MMPPPGPPIPRWAWAFAVCFLGAWNGYLAQYASPFSMTQTYDGAQYQLLARNRLAGHYEVGDQAHTVRSEGNHPMWRPGLVWMLEGLAHVVGSVHTASWILSATGTTFMELTLLWLGWRCFGRVAWVALLLGMTLPFHWNAVFMSLAVGQGPEPWSAAFVLLGWALFLCGRDRRSLLLALSAGAALRGADWFRTGNVLLFLAPWLVFVAAALLRRQRKDLVYSLTTLAGFAAVGFVELTASPVNKTIANLWSNLIEHHGPVLVQQREGGPQIQFLGGLLLAPGTQETYYDHIVRSSVMPAGKAFWSEHGHEIVPLYFERLLEVIQNGGSGLRQLSGEWTIFFAVGHIAFVLVCAYRRRPTPSPAVLRGRGQGEGVLSVDTTTPSPPSPLPLSTGGEGGTTLVTLAFAAGFAAHYFGPVTLLRGDKPTHYLFVALPLLVLVGSGGVAALVELVRAKLCQAQSTEDPPLPPLLKGGTRMSPPLTKGGQGGLLVFAGCLALIPMLVLSASFYTGGVEAMREEWSTARLDRAELDTLKLDGKRIAVRSMAWFADRDVQTVLVPYAKVPELQQYMHHHGLDGLLFRTQEKQKFFHAMPYDSLDAFEKALEASGVRPQTAGTWRWYPVMATTAGRAGGPKSQPTHHPKSE